MNMLYIQKKKERSVFMAKSGMMINVSAVGKSFKFAGKRVPKGFKESLNRLVVYVVEEAVKGKEITKEVILEGGREVKGEFVHEAVKRLEADGGLDQGKLMPLAKELQDQRAKQKEPEAK